MHSDGLLELTACYGDRLISTAAASPGIPVSWTIFDSRSGDPYAATPFPIVRVYRREQQASPFVRALRASLEGETTVVMVNWTLCTRRSFFQSLKRRWTYKDASPWDRIRLTINGLLHFRSPAFWEHITSAGPEVVHVDVASEWLRSGTARAFPGQRVESVEGIAISSLEGDWTAVLDYRSKVFVWLADAKIHERIVQHWPEADMAAIKPKVETITTVSYEGA